MAAIVGRVANLIGPVIELGKCIIAPIKSEFSYLCCFNSHIKSLRDEAEKLEDVRTGLQMQVDVAESKAEEIAPEVQTWLTRANEIQVNKSGIEIKIPNVEGGCLSIISRYSLSKNAKKTTDAMKALQDDNKFDIISLPAPPVATAVIPLGRTYKFESRKHIEKEIMEALGDNKVDIIGIWGMGGVGKTTIAERIRNRVIEEHIFDEAVMATVGGELDELKVLHEISDQLGLPEAKTLPSGAHHLHNRLKGKNKILIVVDDIWKAFQLEDLGIPCQDGVERLHKVLLTSRDKGVLTDMGAEEPYEIKTLDEREAWDLFIEKSGFCSDDFNLLPIAEDIVKECSGLPLALTVVGSGLKNQRDKEIWEGFLWKLKNANRKDVPLVIEKVYQLLKASYELLRNKNAQSLFLLCSLFPEDVDISVKDLTLYCMGLPNFPEIGNLKEARITVRMALNLLKDRFLLLDGLDKHHYVKHDHIRMHDVVRDVAIFIASTEGLAYVNPYSRRHNSYSECKWISFFLEKGSRLLPNVLQLNVPSLHMLMMRCPTWDKLEIEDFSFLEGMKELSVLSLKSISFKSVPQTMQLLKNLRTLHLEFGTLETISVVGELLSLEILCFRHCGSIKELPIEIGRLNRLKLLEFSDCTELKTIPPGVLSNLIELEELTMVRSFNRWELAEAKEKGSRNVNVSLHELQLLLNLRCLNIEIEDYTLAAKEIHFSLNIVEYHMKLGTSISMSNERAFGKKMHLNLPRGITIGNWIRTFVTTTEELCLSGDGSNILDLLQAPNVKSLSLEHCSTVKKLMDATSIDLWKFAILYLSNLPKLEGICDVPITQESNSFKNLKKLSLANLPALEHLWNNPNQNVSLNNLSSITIRECGLCSLAIAMDSLSQLQDLQIDSCSKMKQVFLNKRDGKKSHITFPQLKTLKLSNLKSLTTFCQEIESIEFPMLIDIVIRNCPRITSLVSSIENNQNSASNYLFCSSQVSFSNFPALKSLKLFDLHNLEEICDGPIPMGSNFFKNIKRIEIEQLPKLKHLWKSSHQNEEQEKHGEITTRITFQQLEQLVFRNVENLTIFSKGIESIEFPTPYSMAILGCSKLTSPVSSSIGNHQNSTNCEDDDSLHLFCKVIFGRLKDLRIQGCNNIGKIWCNQIPDSFFTGLNRLEIVKCDSIRSLFSHAIARSLVNLKYLEIERCKEMVKVIGDEEEITGETNCPLLSLFPRLEELKLHSLSKLGSFCEGRCNLELLELLIMKISECPMMKVFTMGSLISAHKLEHIECQKLTSIESAMGLDGNNDDISHLFCSLKITFGRLKDLRIQGCNNIGKICCNQIPDSSFTGLKQLEIVDCDSIRSLFSFAIARNLVSLKYLEIDRCKEMVKVFGDEEEIMGETNCPLLSLFPRLKRLTLDSLPKLRSFFEWRCDLELPMLKYLYIYGCPMMKVFTTGSLISAHKLEHIECQKLTSIEFAMGLDGNNDGTSHLFCSPKITFGRLKDLRIQGCNNIGKIWCNQISDSSFTGLERLEIVDCDSIRSLFSFAIARNLVSLKYLEIDRCKEMVKVIGDEEEITGETNCPLLSLFPRLEELKLHSLPKLGSFCKRRCNLELPGLLILKICECPMMKVFTMGSLISAHKLEHIECLKLTSIESAMGPDDNNDGTSHLFCSPKITFGRLNDLRIQGCKNIAKIWCNQILDSFFTGLDRLEIVDCDSIRSLFSFAIARNLVNLTYLSIERCKAMVTVIGDEEEITGETHCPLLLFSRLQSLKLHYLPKLGSFCEWRCVIELPKLEFVGVRGSMMKAFNMGSLIRMPNLIVVYIEN